HEAGDDAGHVHDAPPSPGVFQPDKIDRSDSCSARLTLSLRAHATGSIRSLIVSSTQSRRSLGSIASSSQQRAPRLAANHRYRGSLCLSVAGNEGSPFTCSHVSAIRLSVTWVPSYF